MYCGCKSSIKTPVVAQLKTQHIQVKELYTKQEWELGKFFSYVCNSKIIKESFAPTLNEITARVRCVSPTTVLVKAKLLD